MNSQELYQKKKKNHTILFTFTQINEQHIQFEITLQGEKKKRSFLSLTPFTAAF